MRVHKFAPLLALLALAALLRPCRGAPLSSHGSKGVAEREEQAHASAAAGGGGTGAGAAGAAWLESDLSLLTTLSDENFTDALASTQRALVIFYAPYSGHCKRARHALAAAAPDIKARHPSVLLAQFDAYGPGQDDNTTFGKLYAPRGYPMVCWFANGTLTDNRAYSRTREGFIAYVEEHMAAGPADGSSSNMPGTTSRDRQEL
ncbi:hypothetical protein ABPG75_000738 [Micractinium tetrahymenae]